MDEALGFGNKTVVVIGGTSGINLGIAHCFAQRGARVAVASRSQDKVDAAVAALQARGAPAMGFAADVRDAEAIREGVAGVHAAFGSFDVVVSGAAGNFPALAMGMSANAFRAVVEIDLLGTFHVMQAVFPYLVKPGAAVINISAPQAAQPMLAQSHVCAAKAGVDMITRTLALEWGPAGIRVNSVIPGPIAGTEGMRRLAPTEAMLAATVESVPLRRIGTAEDIGHACVFLASPLASYINGAVLPVDGGWVLGGAATLSGTLAQLLNAAK